MIHRTPSSHDILGMRVDAVTPSEATELVIDLAKARAHAYVCVANVHMAMEAYDDDALQATINAASLVTPDGMPLAWALRLFGLSDAQRVRGPDLVLALAKRAAEERLPIGLYGGTTQALDGMQAKLLELAPDLNVAIAISPPFRTLSVEENDMYVSQLRSSGARIIFVGLGCPKQERWMAASTTALPAVLVGVGAAFDFHAGLIREAPRWMQSIGMEWFFRVLMEPKRLWRRYAQTNPRFLILIGKQLWRERVGRIGSRSR